MSIFPQKRLDNAHVKTLFQKKVPPLKGAFVRTGDVAFWQILLQKSVEGCCGR
jgi:hypothetical protein